MRAIVEIFWYRLYDHRGIPIKVVRHLTEQTLIALDYLHTKCEIIHTGEVRGPICKYCRRLLDTWSGLFCPCFIHCVHAVASSLVGTPLLQLLDACFVRHTLNGANLLYGSTADVVSHNAVL